MNIPQKGSVHIGRNIRRLREIKNVKQESLAYSLSFSQQKISKLEQMESIDESTLGRIADALELSVEVIKNFDQENVINSCFAVPQQAYHSAPNQDFNAIEKIIELYERLIASEKEKNAILSSKIAWMNTEESEQMGVIKPFAAGWEMAMNRNIS